MEPTFKPVVRDVEDTSNFDEEFLNEPVVDSVVQASQFGNQAADQFNDFTFKGRKNPLGGD